MMGWGGGGVGGVHPLGAQRAWTMDLHICEYYKHELRSETYATRGPLGHLHLAQALDG